MKRRIVFSLLIIFALLPVYFLKSAQPAQALEGNPTCPFASGTQTAPSGITSGTFNITAGDTFTATATGATFITITLPGAAPKSGTGSVSAPATSSGSGFVSMVNLAFPGFTWSVTCNAPGAGCWATDGRLNCQPWETAAVYCLGDGSVRIYVPGAPTWIIAFDASPAEIAKVAKNPAHNTLIKSGKGARLYRLTDGNLQVNSPGLDPSKGDYSFEFPDCPIP